MKSKGMLYAEFSSLSGAGDHREINGGWLFTSDCGRIFWFNLSFTGSAVMLHPALKGMNGKLS
jgi:hypothetical protein